MSHETKLAGHSSQEVKIVNDSIDGPGFWGSLQVHIM